MMSPEVLLLHYISVMTGQELDKLPKNIEEKAISLGNDISRFNAEHGRLDAGIRPEDIIA